MTPEVARKTRPISREDAAEAWTRIEPRLDKSGECWLWTGSKSEEGYGHVWCGGTSRRAHRVVFAQFRGDTTLELDHLCRNPSCCNPAHLEPVTTQENSARGVGPSSWALRDGACKHGHRFVDGSYYVRVDGARQCRECERKRDREAYARDPEKARARRRATRDRNPEKDRVRCRERRARAALAALHREVKT